MDNPGSKEAKENGCICPSQDNNHGQGIWMGVFGRQYVINLACLVHREEGERIIKTGQTIDAAVGVFLQTAGRNMYQATVPTVGCRKCGFISSQSDVLSGEPTAIRFCGICGTENNVVKESN